jgi:cytochrome c551/c552
MKQLTLVLCIAALVAGGVITARAADENPAVTIFKKNGCNECHSISAAGVQKEAKKKAEGEPAPAATAATDKPAATATTDTKKKKTPPDLSGVGLEHDAKWISAFINKEETLDGEKHEKRFKGAEADRRTLAMFLASMKTKVEKKADEATPPAGKKDGQ